MHLLVNPHVIGHLALETSQSETDLYPLCSVKAVAMETRDCDEHMGCLFVGLELVTSYLVLGSPASPSGNILVGSLLRYFRSPFQPQPWSPNTLVIEAAAYLLSQLLSRHSVVKVSVFYWKTKTFCFRWWIIPADTSCCAADVLEHVYVIHSWYTLRGGDVMFRVRASLAPDAC